VTIRPRGPYAKGRQRRDEIIAAALEAYAEAGPRGAPLREIAARAGVTEAGLLHHFGSREELLTAVLQARDAAAAQAFGDTLDADHLDRLVRHNATTPGLVRLFVDLAAAASAPDHPAHGFFRERYRRVLAAGKRALDRQIDTAVPQADDRIEGLDGLDDPAWMSRVLFAAMDGLQLQWLLDDDVDMAADVARLHAALLSVATRARRANEARP
jgi:AcrR family transcriptional regulator